jgi:hypothetical protein
MYTLTKTKTIAFVTMALLLMSDTVMGQGNKVPPRYVEEWYDQRFYAVLIAGAVLGMIVALLWLPRLLPVPHGNDIKRARTHAVVALIVSSLIIAGTLLLDINLVSQFGRQSYQFKDLLSDVFLTRQVFEMIGVAALAFCVVITLWTRFFSEKFYRYMIIP